MNFLLNRGKRKEKREMNCLGNTEKRKEGTQGDESFRKYRKKEEKK